MEFIFDDGGRSETRKGFTGDCVCRSVAIASGLPYEQVYSLLAEGNSKERRAKRGRSASHGIHVTRKWFKDTMRKLGFEWVPTMFIGQGCKVHLRKEELPSGRLVVSVSSHYTSVIDGVIHDTWDPQRDGTRCVYGYWKLV